MSLFDLLPETKGLLSKDILLNSITLNSLDVQKGDLFISIVDSRELQKKYIKEAISRGAAAVLTGLDIVHNSKVPVIFKQDLKQTLGNLSDAFYKSPSKELITFGITGTNGKSSIANYLFQFKNNNGEKTGLISSISSKNSYFSKLTTPDIFSLNKIFSLAIQEKKKSLIFEVSSHAIHQKRIEGINFNYGCFSSFSRDHIDYHGSIKEYAKVKESFFKENSFDSAVINIDSTTGKRIFRDNKNFVSLSSNQSNSDIFLDYKIEGSIIHTPWKKAFIPKNIFAKHIMMNLAASMGLYYLSKETDKLVDIDFKNLSGLPGRMEEIKIPFNQSCYIDYAHTPSALKESLSSLKNKHKGNLICIFGCGGDRDKGKRALMGEIASLIANQIIITSDNPRSEDPKKISLDILKGIKKSENIDIILNRTKAIKNGLNLLKKSKKDSVLIVAGKGHEIYQEISGKLIKQNDLEIIRSFK